MAMVFPPDVEDEHFHSPIATDDEGDAFPAPEADTDPTDFGSSLQDLFYHSDDDEFYTPTGSPPKGEMVPAAADVVDSFPRRTHTEEDDDDALCIICRSEIILGDSIMTLPCNHIYHTSCVELWLTTENGVCPTCRADVSLG